jgi:hypothetical protein
MSAHKKAGAGMRVVRSLTLHLFHHTLARLFFYSSFSSLLALLFSATSHSTHTVNYFTHI